MEINRPKIFISYAWEDKPLVRKLETDLKSAGADLWIDHLETRGGDNLPERICEALEWCDTLLLIWSGAADNSTWVKLEWTNAVSLGKRIIPCLLDEKTLPAVLTNTIYIDFRNYESGIFQLFRALRIGDSTKAVVRIIERLKNAIDYNKDFGVFYFKAGSEGYGKEVFEKDVGEITIKIPADSMFKLVDKAVDQGVAEFEIEAEIEDRLGSPGYPNYMWYETNVKQYYGKAKLFLEIEERSLNLSCELKNGEVKLSLRIKNDVPKSLSYELPEHNKHPWSGW